MTSSSRRSAPLQLGQPGTARVQRRRQPLLPTAAAVAILCGCHSDALNLPAAVTTTEASPGVWSWIPVAGTRCGDGSETGFGINPAIESDTLFIYLNGGGACWDHQTCVVDEAATYVTKGFGPASFRVYYPTLEMGPFNREDNNNPLQNAHYAWLPYCTGDFHAGAQTIDYDGVQVAHVGYHNIGLFLDQLQQRFGDVTRVILAGSSAGGYGTMFNWDRTQRSFQQATLYIINDAGPLLPAPHISAELNQTFESSWKLSASMPADCTDCDSDLSQLHAHLATKYPDTRVALLGFNTDKIIARYLGLDDAGYASGAQALHAQWDNLPNLHYFIHEAEGHAWLPSYWNSFTVHDMSVAQWVGKMISDDPSWHSESALE